MMFKCMCCGLNFTKMNTYWEGASVHTTQKCPTCGNNCTGQKFNIPLTNIVSSPYTLPGYNKLKSVIQKVIDNHKLKKILK